MPKVTPELTAPQLRFAKRHKMTPQEMVACLNPPIPRVRWIPDWETQRVIIADPRNHPYYEKLDPQIASAWDRLKDTLLSLGLDVIVAPKGTSVDIWMRDWFSLPTEPQLLFHYPTPHIVELFGKGSDEENGLFYARHAVEVRRQLLLRHYAGVRHNAKHFPIFMDGGNFSTDGKRAIMTDWVAKQNGGKRAVRKAFAEAGIEKIAFIPVEPGDPLGHTDGVARFLAPDKIGVNHNMPAFNYKQKMPRLEKYCDRVYGILQKEFPDCTLINIPYAPQYSECMDATGSAVGNYMNFFQSSKGSIIPEFGLWIDQTAFEFLSEHLTPPVIALNANHLAEFGGVFNCLTYAL